MAFSIESRVPYLDQELVDHILSLPEDAIVRHGWSRWILRAALKGTLPEKIRLRRWKVGFTTPEMRWIKARRAAFTSLYQSPTSRRAPTGTATPWWRAFRACCKGEVEESMFFWRAANVELWLREFVDTSVVLVDADVEAALSAPVPVGPVHRGSIAEAGDAQVPALLAAAAGPQGPAAAAERRAPPGRVRAERGEAPVRRRRPAPSSPACRSAPTSSAAATTWTSSCAARSSEHVRPGDLVVMAEKPIAASQGRSYALDEIHPTRLAKVLSKAVTKTPHGIGLGIPETMQLAIDEAGAPRIVAAAAVSAAGKVVGKRGLFYKVAGADVEAIDGPTWNTLPPHNTHAKLGPAGSGRRRRAPRGRPQRCRRRRASSSSSSTPTTSPRPCSALRRAPIAPWPGASCGTTRSGRATSRRRSACCARSGRCPPRLDNERCRRRHTARRLAS